MARKALYKGLAATLSAVLAVTVPASALVYDNAGIINTFLGAKTTEIVTVGEGQVENTVYYDNAFGTDTTNLATTLELEQAVQAENLRQAEEGNVLLKNENNTLPLGADAKVTLFGNGAQNSRYCKSEEGSSMEQIEKQTFPVAMQNVFGADQVNTVLCDEVYKSLSQTTNSAVYEAPVADVKAKESSWQSDYNDAAIVMLTRWGSEDSETVELTEDGRHYLGLSAEEEDLLNYLREQKSAGVFEKIVVVINADQMMELGWLDEYEVDACLLAGIPGQEGFRATAKILRGDVNPSGHLVDTYVKDYTSSPAMAFSVDGIKEWDNVTEVDAAFENALQPESMNHVNYYTIYAENIYVGYKYYETRYEDLILGAGNADSDKGSTVGASWNYADEMAYTFGYGLSYTTFDKSLEEVSYDEETDTYTISVKVTNTGDVAGKEVVQVYAQTPYDAYEKDNAIEKSAVMLAGFEKSALLQPGESETLQVPVERYLLASYDANNLKGYYLSAGDYYFAVGNDAHDAVNNILAAKGYSAADGMIDMLGQAADGNQELVYQWSEEAQDTESYRYSRYDTDVEVTNQFDDNSLEAYGVAFTYLSRSDWDATYPDASFTIAATQQMVDDLIIDWYESSIPEDAPAVSDFTQGENKGISFVDMKDIAWEDDEMWNAFLDQLTVEEMLSIKADGNGNDGITSVNMPADSRADDGVCIQQGSLDATEDHAFTWVSEVMTSRTWNKELFSSRGEYLGIEAVFCSCNELWYGGGNVHRTAFGGRNMQYYSEDGIMGYYVGLYEAEAMQAVGINYGIKHLALNDTEAHRESLSTFATEQSIREIYLRAMEGAVAVSQCSVMTGFNRIGCQYVATDKDLLTNIVKGEWALKNHITTDAGDSGYKSHMLEQMAAGIDYTCWNTKTEDIAEAIAGGDGYALQLLRQATKYNVYSSSRTISVNGLSSNTVVRNITPAWQIAVAVAGLLLALLSVLFVILYIVTPDKKRMITIEKEVR